MRREQMISQLAAAGSVPLGDATEEELAAASAGGVAGDDARAVIRAVCRAPAAVVFAEREPFRATFHGFREQRLTGSAAGISGFLEERLDRSGRHHFTLRTTPDAIAAVVALAAGPAPAGQVTTLNAFHSRPAGVRQIRASFLVRPGDAAVSWSASGVEPAPPRVLPVDEDGLRQVVRDVMCDPGGDPPGDNAIDREDSVPSSEGPPFRCPVCGYLGLDEPARTAESGPSYDMCPSCGFEFGVTDDDRGFSYADWRREWIANGSQWWSRGRRKPPGWDAAAQLRALAESGPDDETSS
jgi:predicted RNA-binding Zn-ribbon protein involved in translation (DUF1610 family)